MDQYQLEIMLFAQGIICCFLFLAGINFIAKQDGADEDKFVGIGLIISAFIFGWWSFN